MKAKAILIRAGVQLLDQDFIRWPLPELVGHIDEGVAQIVSVKPSVASTLITLELARGTKQALPDDPRIVQLLDITRNVEGSNGSGGRMVRAVARSELDSNEPRWHDARYVPFRREVRHYVYDELLPRDFYVFPGNDGNGKVEAAVSQLPERVADRLTGAGTALDDWDIDVGLRDEYEPALLDYVLYRAFAKDDPAASIQRSVAHYQAFATSLGLKSEVESSTSPSRGR